MATQMTVKNCGPQVFLGGFVILVVSLVFIFLNGNYGFFKKESCYQIFGKFNDISGLSIGSKVKISGVNVGKVESIGFDSNSRMVLIEMCINNGVKIPDDTVATIAYENFFSGTKLVNLELGISSNFLAYGDQFSLTYSSVNLESIIRQFITAK